MRITRFQICGHLDFGERFIEAMTDIQHLYHVEVRDHGLGVELDSLAIFRHRVVELALIAERAAEAVVRIVILRVELD